MIVLLRTCVRRSTSHQALNPHRVGRGFKKLSHGNELLYVQSRAVVLQVTKPLIYTVKGKAPYGVGLKMRPNCDKTFFVVSNVYAGSIEHWNEENPDMRVSIGDVVREVNGVKGSAVEVEKMLLNDPNNEKEFLVFHYPAIGEHKQRTE